MFLKNLRLTNFRNFSQVDLNFNHTTLLLGNNAQGKSNLLEAVYFLATTKSPRADTDSQLIRESQQFCLIEGQIEGQSNEEVTKLEIGMQFLSNGEKNRLEKRVKVNGVPRRVTDYIGRLVVIHFSPEDINLVSGPPALRRWHLDLSLAQIDKEYKTALSNYHAALISRNRILKNIKEGIARLNELDYWTDNMILSGQIISAKRNLFFGKMNEYGVLINNEFADFGNSRFIYQESVISQERIREYLSREIAAATSLIGPHRDDFIFKLEGRDLAYFGSRGEQRTAVLELKLAQLRFIQEVIKTAPVLLLDDVFSELDEKHRGYIISTILGQQTILSAVDNEHLPEEFLSSAKIVKVEKGKLVE